MGMTIKRVAIYCRVSTADQADEGYGMEYQMDDILKYIKSNSKRWWEVIDHLTFEDGWHSGSTQSRPQLDRMRAEIMNGSIDVVVVWKFDRLFRDPQYLLELMKLCNLYRVELVSATENIDLSSSTGVFMATIMWWMAAMERSNITRRTMQGKIAKSRDGYYLSPETPYWYSKTPDKKLIIHPEQAEVVRRIFDMYVNEGKTQYQIAAILTAEGIPLKSDEMKCMKKKINPRWTWLQGTICWILSRTHYVGHYYFNKMEYRRWPDGKKCQVEKPKEEWIEMKCERILDSDELFDRAQVLLKQNRALAKKPESHRYLLASVIFCGEDGLSYRWYKSTKGTYNYRCVWKNKGKRVVKCTNSDISATQVDGLVWSCIEKIILNPRQFEKHFESVSAIQSKIDTYKQEMLNIEETKKTKQEFISDLLDTLVFATTPSLKEEVKKKLSRVESEIVTMNNRLTELEILIHSERQQESVKHSVKRISVEFKSHFQSMKDDNVARHKLVLALVNKVLIFPDRIEIYFKFRRADGDWDWDDGLNPYVFPRNREGTKKISWSGCVQSEIHTIH